VARTATFILILTGAFLIWATKGFKGKSDNEMVSIADKFSTKGNIRYYLGLGFWIIVLILTSVTLTRQTETKTYKVKTNDKGEIIELEEVK